MKSLIFSLLSVISSFKVKSKGTSLFLGNQGDVPKMVSDPNMVLDFELPEKTSIGYVFKGKNMSKVLNIEGHNPKGNLIFWPRAGTTNEKFDLALTSDGTAFMLKNMDGCMEVQDDNRLKRAVCDESRTKQLFVRVDSETNTEQPAPPKSEKESQDKSNAKDGNAPIIIIHEHGHKPRRTIESHYHHNNLVDHNHDKSYIYETNSSFHY